MLILTALNAARLLLNFRLNLQATSRYIVPLACVKNANREIAEAAEAGSAATTTAVQDKCTMSTKNALNVALL